MNKSNVDLKSLLAKMTIKEKICQLVQLNGIFFAENESEITGPADKLGIDTEDLKFMGTALSNDAARRIQEEHLKNDPNKIPMIIMCDVIHGFRTIYPIPLALGCTFDPELVAECSRMAAKETSAAGVHLTFTPMVDYARDARWGRIMETCGEDPYLNGVMGAAQVKAFQGDDLSNPDNIAACVKHFAAYGGAEAGRDYNTVELSEHLLREFYLPAYKACIDAGVVMLMPSFNNLNGVPSTANKWLMQKVLREEWGYEGIVISDYAAVKELIKHGVAADMKEAAELAFSNGCDIEMMSSAYYNHLKELIEEGVFTEEQLDASVMKVLELKKALGLFEDPYRGSSEEKEKALFLCDEHREIVRRAAEESAVLLKNDGILPFSEDVGSIALIGPFADNKTIYGMWSCRGTEADTVSIREGVEKLLPKATIKYAKGCASEFDALSKDGFAEAVALAKECDVVILCVGENRNYSGEGNSRVDINLPGVQADLVREVVAANPRTAVVLCNGRPLALGAVADEAPAILESWFMGTEAGNAIANLLFGRANPCGKLSTSFPKAVGQCPIYYNRTNTGRWKTKPEEIHQPYASSYIGCGNLPRFFFGEGLSYTEFAYESMTLDRTEMTKDDVIRVSVTVRNVGERAGKEVVQLYLHDLVSSTVRPIQELIAFEKIALEAGEAKTVVFEIREPMLRLWNPCNEFVSEKGEFTVSVGYADHMKYTETFRLV